MRCELPVFLRCCFCFPLRYGLLVCSYTKQIVNILLGAFIIFSIHERRSRTNVMGWNLWFPVLLIVYIIFDISFNVLFIIGGHTKNYKKIRIFYRYIIVTQCVYAVVLGLLIFDCVHHCYLHPYFIQLIWYIWMPAIATIISSIIMQFYLIILVRSEFLKLKNNAQFEFVNHAAAEKCTADIDFEKQIPEAI